MLELGSVKENCAIYMKFIQIHKKVLGLMEFQKGIVWVCTDFRRSAMIRIRKIEFIIFWTGTVAIWINQDICEYRINISACHFQIFWSKRNPDYKHTRNRNIFFTKSKKNFAMPCKFKHIPAINFSKYFGNDTVIIALRFWFIKIWFRIFTKNNRELVPDREGILKIGTRFWFGTLKYCR